jgi:beta-lactamase regulating signal transducer with metallopeptidase domain
MNPLLAGPWWTPLVTALAHSLWQGAVLAVLLFLALRTVPARWVNARYGLSAASMLLLALGWLMTWTWLERDLAATPPGPASATAAGGTVSLAPPAPTSSAQASPGAMPLTAVVSDPPASPWIAPFHGPRWHARLGLAWLAGMLLFQVRILLAVGRARGLVRQSRILDDPGLLSRFHRLRSALGLSDRIVLRVSSILSVPAAWGILKPVVLIPASCLARVTPAQLEGILAHELAHIRRHDVLANLVQMGIEGLFFFNPFAWWIGRQIRLEREVCCDHLAVAATGEPAAYARTLASLVGPPDPSTSAPPAPMPALGQPRNPLLERLRRLLQPHRAPALHLPRSTLVITLALGALALSLMKWTTAAALEALAPVQRIERFAELRATYPNPTWNLDSDSQSEATQDPASTEVFHGAVRTAEGAPLPQGIWVHLTSRRAGHTSSFSVDVGADGRFRHAVPTGDLYLTARAEGYAPAFVGPLEFPAQWTNITLVLDHGFTRVLRLTDPAGRPVPGARVVSYYDFPANPGNLESVSDADGRVTLEHVGRQPLQHSVEANGFQFDALRDAAPSPDQPLAWVVHPAVPTGGVVVFSDTGEPVPGAQIHLGQRTGTRPASFGEPGPGNFLARADAGGRFEIRTFRDDAQYHVLVSGPGASGIVAGPVGSGDRALRFELPRAVWIDVQVRNIAATNLDGLGRLTVHASAAIRYPGSTHVSSVPFHAVPDGGAATFRVGPLWRSPISLTVADRRLDLSWEEAQSRTEPWIVDLALQNPALVKAEQVEPTRRTLRVAFPNSADRPAPRGAVLVEYVHDQRLTRTLAAITNNLAMAQVPVPTRVELLPGALDGYWFAPKSLDVPAAPEPLDIALETLPAGAIHGEVVEEDGQPATGVMVTVIAVEPRPAGAGSSLGVTVKDSTGSDDRRNRFLAGPLPFGGRYAICAHRGTSYALTDSLVVDAANPFHQVRLVLPRGVVLAGTVLRPDGTPLIRESVEFQFSATAGHGFAGAKAVTDRAGRFSFDQVNPQVRGEYHLVLPLRRDFQPVRQRVIPGEPAEIRLQPGLILEGKVLDHSSGLPLPGAEVFALPAPPTDSRSRWTGWLEPEGPSDAEGRFRFSNLAPGNYQVLTRSGRLITPVRPRTAGNGEPVVLQIEPYPGRGPTR